MFLRDFHVGKDELLNSLCHWKESADRIFLTRTFCIYGQLVKVQIWNLSNDDILFPLSKKAYTRDAPGALVVYDVTSRGSLKGLHRCFNFLDSDTKIMILGIKCDKTDHREVTKEEGENLAAEKRHHILRNKCFIQYFCR